MVRTFANTFLSNAEILRKVSRRAGQELGQMRETRSRTSSQSAVPSLRSPRGPFFKRLIGL
jgi:hypothetical protein